MFIVFFLSLLNLCHVNIHVVLRRVVLRMTEVYLSFTNVTNFSFATTNIQILQCLLRQTSTYINKAMIYTLNLCICSNVPMLSLLYAHVHRRHSIDFAFYTQTCVRSPDFLLHKRN